MASFSCIHQAIARLQAVSASHLHLEPICIGPFRLPLNKSFKLLSTSRDLSSPSTLQFAPVCWSSPPQAKTQPPLLEVDFVWKGKGSQVSLTGDFLGWDTKVSLAKGTDGAFHCKQKLSPGTHKYKYIIDGEWAHSPDSPMIEDGQGGYNNQIIITDGPSASSSSPSKESSPIETAGVKDTAETAQKAAVSTKAAKADTVAAVPKAEASPKAAKADTVGAVPKAEASPKAAKADTVAAGPKAEASPKAAKADTVAAVPKAEASPKVVKADTVAAVPKAEASPKAAPSSKPVKKAEKPYPQVITEDVIPRVKSHLQKEEGVSDINLVFEDNQLEGSFMKSGIIYTFWAFFPDGKLEGARGFSVSSHGAPPSTVEPFLIDEKKITADLLVFWVLKRLAAQSIISSKRV